MAGEQLWVSEGRAQGERLRVNADMLIGRAAGDELGRLHDDPEISRRHARISRAPSGQLTIEDLGSANGTHVNGRRIEAAQALDLGDVVKVGQTVLQVTDASGRIPQPTHLGAAPAAGGGAARREQLLVTEGAAEGSLLTIGDEFLIGRAETGEGRLGDEPELSRRHARIARDDEGLLTIEDLGSANGTYVNDVRVSGRQVLRPGDSLRLGRTTLRVTDPEVAPAPPATEAPPRPVEAAPVAPAPPRPPAPVAPAPAPAPREAGAGELSPGTVFAGCRVEEVIGRGDMGVVYRAEELALQRPVALKLILPELSQDERFRERFRRESKLAASIDHPNVIPILEAGEEDGVLFLTMRLVRGTDLRALIATREPIDPLRVARIVRQVGSGLDAAHKRGLVHRDVKPANVLLARRDHVYLSDFGLAKHAASAGGLTRQGSIVARAEYVAPEQILEDRVDALTDVYALGCLLFEALTGQAPFATASDGPAMLAHVDAPRPSAVALRPDLPTRFDAVVQRAMAVDPSERYQSAGDLGDAALVAAGELARTGPEAVVATGEAAPRPGPRAPEEPLAGGETARAEPSPDRAGPLRWGVALGVLALLAVGMVAALAAISRL